MHQALLIAEILQRICEHADGGTLTVIARTAQILHEPAIAVIWHTLPAFECLVRCFPQDSRTVEGDIIGFTRALAPDDWTTVLKYASHVRRLSFRGYALGGYNTSAWETICLFRPVQILFSELRVFRWYESEVERLPSLLLCLGDALASVHLHGNRLLPDARRSLEIALRTITNRFPSLRELTLNYTTSKKVDDPGVVVSHSTLAGSLSYLTHFYSPNIPITEAAMVHLAVVKPLRNLTIRLPEDVLWSPQGVEPACAEPLFAQLATIDLHGTEKAFTAFSERFRFRVKSLTLHINGGYHSVGKLTAAIRRQFCSISLQKLAIHSDVGLAVVDDLGPAVTPTGLRPLLAFGQMREFRLWINRAAYALDDAFFSNLASAWRAVESLVIAYRSEHNVLPSIRALSSFAALCPNLNTLRIRFDARRWASQEEFIAEDVRRDVYHDLAVRASTSQLRRLYVGTSPIDKPELVAAFLARVFPKLSRILTGYNGEQTTKLRWRAVQDLLSLFGRVRRDERQRISEGVVARKQDGET